MKYIIALTAFCFTITLAKAQKDSARVWTLQDCIDYAAKNNLQLKQNRLNTEISESQYNLNGGAMLPRITGNASQNYSAGYNINPYTNTFVDTHVKSNNFSLNASLPIWEGLQLQNNLQQSRYSYYASKYDVEKSKNDLILNVINAYVGILFNEDLLKTSQEQLDVSKNQLERTKRLVEVGNSPKGSLLDAESQAANEEVNVINAQNQLDISYLNLVQLLDLPNTRGFNIVDPKLTVYGADNLDYNSDSIYSYAVKNQPDVKSAELKERAANYALRSAKGSLSPTLSVGASLSTIYSDQAQTSTYASSNVPIPILDANGNPTTYYFPYPQTSITGSTATPFRTQLNDNFSKSLSFNLSIPILTGFQAELNIRRYRAQHKQAEVTTQQTKLALNKTIQQANADAHAAFKKYMATEKALASQTEAFKYMQEKFNVGLVTSVDYLTAKNNLNHSQANLLQAKYDFIVKTKALDFYMGKPLTF